MIAALGETMSRRKLTAAVCLLLVSGAALAAESPIAFAIHGGAGGGIAIDRWEERVGG
jgi:hypothetical protein